ncbi:MAG: 50S ribosomal protein L9 [bacterium]|nr:50S ribosomal protein L9 [bacterium]
MKVILLQKVQGLGNIDDIKEVSDGYAVNFLFPRHLAVPASAKSLSEVAAHKNKRAKDQESDLRSQQSLADRLDGLEIKFSATTTDKGLLYSAVTASKIAERLQQMGFVVDKKKIAVGAIKTLGEFPAKVKFPHGLEAGLNIVVVST